MNGIRSRILLSWRSRFALSGIHLGQQDGTSCQSAGGLRIATNVDTKGFAIETAKPLFHFSDILWKRNRSRIKVWNVAYE
jgi:hypothetical protein